MADDVLAATFLTPWRRRPVRRHAGREARRVAARGALVAEERSRQRRVVRRNALP
jgi:hypothetical protein